MSERHARLLRIVLIAATIFALVMALVPRPPSVGVSDKWQHMAAFGTLTVLAAAAYPRASLLRIGERLSFLGAMIELFQSTKFIGRDCDLMDWVADTTIIIAVLIVVAAVRQRASATS